MLTTVLIDVDNTLLDFNECVKEAVKETFREWRLEYSEKVFPVFKEVNDMLWLRIEAGELDRAGLYKIRWQMIFDRLGIDASGPLFENDFRLTFSESRQAVEGAYDILEYLSSKYTICAASNASAWQQNKRLRNADMMKYISHMFISEEVGAPKPKKKFFDICLERLGNIPKDEVVLIGDSLSADISGGIAYGIKTIWFNYDKAPIPDDLKVDHIVYSLSEIKNYI